MAEPIAFPSLARPQPVRLDEPRLILLPPTEDEFRRLWRHEQARACSWKRRARRIVRLARKAEQGITMALVWGGLGWFMALIFGLALGLVG